MKLLSRKKSVVTEAAPVGVVKPNGKNRPTPKRTEARSSRPITPYMNTVKGSRKENSKIDRQRRRGGLDATRSAMRGTGDLSKLPVKDARPEAGFVRALVDKRRNLVTLIILSYLLLFLNFLVKGNYLILTLIVTIFFIAIVDGFVLSFTVKKAMREEFPGSREKVRLYAVQRAIMPRRMRLPRPGVGVARRR